MTDDNINLKKLQSELILMLNEIDAVCTKNNITYFLVGGTLLGAKRHQGFIPWDDDLDIAMLREDYQKFEQICKTELNNNLYFKNFHLDTNYFLPFGKICKKNTSYVTEIDCNLKKDNEIFIDVFPLDYVKKEDSINQKIQALTVKGIRAVIWRRKKLNIASTTLKVRIIQLLCLPFSTKFLMKYQEKIMQKYNNKKLNYLVNNGSNYNYKKQTMPYNYYFPAKKMKFENKEFSVPNQTEKVLEKIYGKDYMILPPIEKRTTHKIIKLKF